MYSMNRVQFVGHLGKDIEVRYSPAGNAFGGTSIATSRRVKKGDNYEEVTDWHNLVIIGKQAENAAKHLGKGSYVFVEGSLQTRKWTDKEGQDRYTTEVVVSNIGYLEKKSGDAPTPSSDQGDDFSSEDIPF